MKLVGELIAKLAGHWLDGLRARRGLSTGSAPHLWQRGTGERLLLHVGCGHARKEALPGGFHGQQWREIRLDADPEVPADVIGSMTRMPVVPDGAVGAVFTSHGIEHLYWHEVPLAFGEFLRVLDDDGFLVVTCPDLQSAAEWIAADRLFDVAYVSPGGAITPYDIVFSYRPFVARNPQWMAHHGGFTLKSLTDGLTEAGFSSMFGFRRRAAFDLWVLATKRPRSRDELSALAADYLPASA